jgi:hypothetical protein
MKYLLSYSTTLSFITEISYLKQQIIQFKEKYNYYPGDSPFIDEKVVNVTVGNGDGYIDDKNESLFAWRHMQWSDLIKLDFLYQPRSYAKLSYNMFKSKFVDCGYQILTDRKLNHVNYFFADRMVFLRIAQDKNLGNLSKSCLSAKHAAQIDYKIDDGYPLDGKLFSDQGYLELSVGKDLYKNKGEINSCICKNNNAIYTYCLSSNNVSCIMQLNIDVI